MGWGEVFFGFHGRINRGTFWSGWIVVSIAGVLLIALLAYLTTGNPASTDIWLAPAGKERLWVPVWLAWLAFLAWPLAALAIKRLHDRDRPAWLWYAYYCMMIVFSLPPLKNMTGAELTPVAAAAMLLLLIFGVYVFFELAVLRGTRGAEQPWRRHASRRILRRRLQFPEFDAGLGRADKPGEMVVRHFDSNRGCDRGFDWDEPCERGIHCALSWLGSEPGEPGLDEQSRGCADFFSLALWALHRFLLLCWRSGALWRSA